MEGPRLEDLRRTLRPELWGGADRSIVDLRAVTGARIDPTDPVHAAALFRWLNRWGCRISLAAEPAFVAEVGAWWTTWGRQLPGPRLRLAALSDAALVRIADAADELASLPLGGRRLQWTAAAKLLFVLRPHAVCAWDKAIAGASGGQSRDAFLVHLRRARSWAQALGDDDVPTLVGRPGATVAQVLDEYLYLTITAGQPG